MRSAKLVTRQHRLSATQICCRSRKASTDHTTPSSADHVPLLRVKATQAERETPRRFAALSTCPEAPHRSGSSPASACPQPPTWLCQPPSQLWLATDRIHRGRLAHEAAVIGSAFGQPRVTVVPIPFCPDRRQGRGERLAGTVGARPIYPRERSRASRLWLPCHRNCALLHLSDWLGFLCVAAVGGRCGAARKQA